MVFFHGGNFIRVSNVSKLLHCTHGTYKLRPIERGRKEEGEGGRKGGTEGAEGGRDRRREGGSSLHTLICVYVHLETG